VQLTELLNVSEVGPRHHGLIRAGAASVDDADDLEASGGLWGLGMAKQNGVAEAELELASEQTLDDDRVLVGRQQESPLSELVRSEDRLLVGKDARNLDSGEAIPGAVICVGAWGGGLDILARPHGQVGDAGDAGDVFGQVLVEDVPNAGARLDDDVASADPVEDGLVNAASDGLVATRHPHDDADAEGNGEDGQE
jgi:hypothetical protein